MPGEDVKIVIRAIDKATKPVQNVSKGLRTADASAKTLNTSLKTVGRTIGKVFAALAIFQVAKSIVTLGANMEQTRIAFTTFLGDAEKANVVIAQLNEFSNVTPFDNDAVIKSGRILLAAGIPAEQLTDKLKNIGDIASGANVPLEEMANIYAKTMNKGKLQAEELNQLGERSVPLLDHLAKKWGMTKGEVMKLGSQGKITSDIMDKAFAEMTTGGGMFADMMKKQSESLGGRFSTLIGKMQMLGISIGEAIGPALGIFVDLGIVIAENGAVLLTVAEVVGIFGVAWAALQVPMVAAAAWTSILTAKTWLLAAAMNATPVGLIVAGIAALVAGFVIAWRHSEKFRAVIMGLWESAKVVFDNLKRIFTDIPDLIIGAIKGIPRAIADVFSGIGDLFAAIFTGDFSAIPGILADLGTNILKSNPLTASALAIGTELGKGTGKAFNKGFEEEVALDRYGKKKGAITGGAGATDQTPGGLPITDPGNLVAGISEVKAGAPKTFNINIHSLIEALTFNTQTIKDSTSKIEDEVKRTLLTVLADAQTVAK